MKKSILLTILLLFSLKLYAEEPVMKVHLQDGSERVFEISGIDSLEITKTNVHILYIYLNFRYIYNFLTTEFSDIRFEYNDNEELALSYKKFIFPQMIEIYLIDSIIFTESECEIDGFKFNYLNNNIHLVSRSLEELPECIGNLAYLENLNLSDNKLTNLPESIGHLIELKNLNLTSNRIKRFPESLKYCTYFSSLSLSDNQLSDLPENFNFIFKLSELNLSKNKFTAFPVYLCNMNIGKLDLSDNQISTIPDCIESIPYLYSLIFNNNKLQYIPDVICYIESLYSLHFNSNQLKKIPDNIGNLRNLTILSLSDNQLTTLPIGLLSLKDKLQSLHLENNNFSDEEKKKIESWLPNTQIYW